MERKRLMNHLQQTVKIAELLAEIEQYQIVMMEQGDQQQRLADQLTVANATIAEKQQRIEHLIDTTAEVLLREGQLRKKNAELQAFYDDVIEQQLANMPPEAAQ